MTRYLSQLFSLRSVVASSILIPATLALRRTIGPHNDPHFNVAVKACNGSDPKEFEFGVCSLLIACVYEKLNENFKASLSSGTNIVSLLPTILVLIGSPPLELVELAFLSPHRAIAACCFSIGLPSSLFRQLRPLRLQPSNPNASEARVREWTVFLPSICRSRWQHLIVKLAVDIIIAAMVSIMLWRNLVVTSFTMVPWRCEWPWLLPAWPIACMIWLLMAVVLLHFMKESIRIYNPADPSTEYSIWGLVALPYIVTLNHESEESPNISTLPSHGGEMETITTSYSEATPPHNGSPDRIIQQQGPPPPEAIMRRSYTSFPGGLGVSNCVTIRIAMPSNFGFRCWRWYEALIETAALGIYLYATFVLTSLLFLNADKAIEYATVMAICLSIVKILTVLF